MKFLKKSVITMDIVNKKVYLSLLLIALSTFSFAQKGLKNNADVDRPKLIVGIVVDQMRYDYLPRYWDKFGEDGFKRLVNQGFNFANTHYNYFPTYTGPGHAAIYSGTTPSVNGIVGNSWYDRSIDDNMYVVSDSTVTPVGTDGDNGKMSPANLLSTTVTDELKLANPDSKIITVSIKDRGAILPGGHLADGAYWYEDQSGHFVSSSWYVDQLPGWVRDFNATGLARELSNRTWETLLSDDQYTASNPDDTPYEGAFEKENAPVFPHKLGNYTGDSYGIVKSSPFGNTLVREFAKKAVDGAKLGTDQTTDFLGISFSSTDYVGHQFGPHSMELEDTYIRLDRDLADLLDYLDREVGKGNYFVMLTSDHGVVDVPSELMDKGLPGGYFDSDEAIDQLSAYLDTEYGEAAWIEGYINQQVYLDRDLIIDQDISLEELQKKAANFLLKFDGVLSTNTAYNFQNKDHSDGHQAVYQHGYQYERSGDVYIQLKSGWLDSTRPTGTSHGSPYNYDTHVPLVFYGWNIPRGETSQKTVITQVAPTLSSMLDIAFPSGSHANVLKFEE
jgi:predicted AlkP superfamily pyrophosphatase or phosphodiesterase